MVDHEAREKAQKLTRAIEAMIMGIAKEASDVAVRSMKSGMSGVTIRPTIGVERNNLERAIFDILRDSAPPLDENSKTLMDPSGNPPENPTF